MFGRGNGRSINLTVIQKHNRTVGWANASAVPRTARAWTAGQHLKTTRKLQEKKAAPGMPLDLRYGDAL